MKTKPVYLTKKQAELIIACINAELELNDQCDTSLSLSVTRDSDDPDKANSKLRESLMKIQEIIKKAQSV